MADQIVQAQLTDEALNKHFSKDDAPIEEPPMMAPMEFREPPKIRSRLRLISVLASLFVSVC